LWPAACGCATPELVTGELGWLFAPASQVGIALVGLGWILLGLDVAFRRRRIPEPPPGAQPSHR
jgi:hypothetical protein